MGDGTIRLSSGRLELEINPAIGGAIGGFFWIDQQGRRPILRERPGKLQDVLQAASFPLVPYVNRIRGGRFSFRGREVTLQPNMEGDSSPLHGQGWLGAWQIQAAAHREAVLSFRHESGEWPWAYEARQTFVLDDDGFRVTLNCRNLCDRPMPCGLGQHPYFPCGSATRIETAVSHVWTIDEHVLPVEKVPAEGRFDLSDRLVCGQDLDHGFGGWNGLARLSDDEWPFDVELSSPNARFFQLYSPKTGGICVVEPVSHANDALSAPEEQWPELGMRVLEPGEEMQLEMRIRVIAK
jgi:aldose 1-epimerase